MAGLNNSTNFAGLTQYAPLYGGTVSTSVIKSLGAAGTTGQVLQSAGASAPPAYSTATYPLTTVANQLLYSSATNVVGGITVANNGILISNGSGVPSYLGIGTTGQVLTVVGGAPAWAAAPAGPGDITSWVNVTGTTQAMVDLTGYYANNATAVAFTLPATAAMFDYMKIVGIQGSWNIIQGAGQSIVFGTITSTVGTGGSISSSFPTDTIILQCIVANTTWQIVDAVGNLNWV